MAAPKESSKQGLKGRNNSAKPSFRPRKVRPVLATPPDGGWGWMVVLASFFISVLVDGVCFSIGIFFNPFREYYGSTNAETSWVGSALNGTYLTIGPLVSGLVSRYGCRPVAVLGSVIASVSLFASTFSPSIGTLILVYGVLTGIGLGFVYLPSMVMVGYYFERRRALATGIACCGSGIGAFAFAPLCNFLLEEYGWKGATWIMSGLVLNMAVFSLLYRPLKPSSEVKVEPAGRNFEAKEQSVGLLTIPEESCVDSSKCEEAAMPDAMIPVREESFRSNEGPCPKSPANSLASSLKVPQFTLSAEEGKTISLLAPEDRPGEMHKGSMLSSADEKLLASLLSEYPHESVKADAIFQTIVPEFQPTYTIEATTYASEFQLRNNAPVLRKAYSQELVNKNSLRPYFGRRQHYPAYQRKPAESPMQRLDIFYGGHLEQLEQYKSSSSLDAYRQKVTRMETVEDYDRAPAEGEAESEQDVIDRGTCCQRCFLEPLSQIFDFALLQSPTFLVYGMSCFLCMAGFFIPFVYLPTLAEDLQIERAMAAFLISIIGIANTVGRVLVGYLSDQPWVDPLTCNNFALIIGGAATIAVPWIKLYGLLAFYAVIFGTSIAVFVSLRAIIMVQLIGLEKLTNAFGLVIMCQGFTSFIGAPIAGALSDATGSYSASFYMGGSTLVLAGLICLPLRRIASWENSRFIPSDAED